MSALGLVLAGLLPAASGASLYWDGPAAGWDSVANWSTASNATTPDPTAVPGVGDSAIFNLSTVNGATTVSLNANQSVQGLVFNNTGTTALQGGGTNRTLTIGSGGITVNSGAGAVTLGSTTAGQNVPIIVSASQVWTNNSTSALTIVNAVTGGTTASQALELGGSGNITWDPAGSITAVSGSSLNITKTGAGTVQLGTTSNGTANNPNGALTVSGGTFNIGGRDLIVTGLTGGGAVGNGSSTIRWFFVNNAVDNTFTGTLQNSGSAAMGVNKSGAGTLTLTGTNTYTDRTTVNIGTVEYGSSGVAGITQSLGTLFFDVGSGTVKSTQGNVGTNSLTFTTLGRTAGATGNFVVSGGTNGSTNQIRLTQAAGFINQGMFFGGGGYAWMDATNTFVRGLVYGSDAGAVTSGTTTSLASATHQQFTGDITAQNNATFTTLNVAGNHAFTLNGGATVQANGILKSGNVAGGATISGGAGLQAATANAEFIVRTDGANDTLSIATPVLANGTSGLTKGGAGTLNLGGANTYTGATIVGGGTLNLNGSSANGILTVRSGTANVTGSINGTSTAGTVLVNPPGNSTATLNLNGGTILVGGNAANNSPFVIGNVAGGSAIFNMSSGSLTTGGTSTQRDVRIGNNGYGVANISGGTITIGGYLVGGIQNAGAVGIWNISGGSVEVNSGFNYGGTIGATANTTGLLNVTGGGFTNTQAIGTASGIYVGEAGAGILNVSGTGVVTLGSSSTSAGLDIGRNNVATSLGIVNLRSGGTISTTRVGKTGAAATGYLNFHGGTLQARSGANSNFLSGLTGAQVYSGGGTIDNNGQTLTIAQPLLAPSGSGVTSIAVTGGTGYLGMPLVAISGGGGSGATAIANLDGGGNLAGITITNPGQGYTSAPNVALTGGGGQGASVGTVTVGASASGGLTFAGGGTTTLTGVNTYTGDTTVTGGTLALADNAGLKFVVGANGVGNKITGTGTATLDGDFTFDLTGASTTVGHSWQIANVASQTFGPTFSVPGFAVDGERWIKPANGAFYEFDEATGILRVINDPSIVYPPPSVTPGAFSGAYTVGGGFTLQVGATGTGVLSYQWYYQATEGDTPVAISGATSASYSLSNLATSQGGIYSVVVTDTINGSTTTTATTTFPLTVLTVAESTVAYYRFEEGAASAAVSTATDSSTSAANTLTAGAGSATFSTDVPFSQVPGTSAANSRSADFGTTGINSLLASTSGPLSEQVFTDFTIETFVKFNAITGVSTFVGRDDSGSPGVGAGVTALFYLQRNGNNIRVELIDKSNVTVQAVYATTPVTNKWYHVAAVGDVGAGTLKLYVDGQLVGTGTGFTGLYVPSPGSDTAWTVGRGDYNGLDTDAMRGSLDEVRFCRVALPPAKFLNSAGGVIVSPPTFSTLPASATVRTGGGASFTVLAGSTMTPAGTITYQWYKDNVLLSGETGATLTVSGATTLMDGTYSVVATDSNGVSAGVPITSTALALLRVIDVPAASRALSLNFVGAANVAGTFSATMGSMLSADSAGFVPVANWNNSATVNGVAIQTAPLSLSESTGASSLTTAVWTSANTWGARASGGDPALKIADRRLFHGYIESRAATGASVTVSNISYASYDVYVYVAGGTAGAVGTLSIDRTGAPVPYYRIISHDSYEGATVPFMIGDAVNVAGAQAAPAASFARFAGVTGDSLTITARDAVLNANAGGIAAIEIVDRTPAGTPYPPSVTTAPASLLKTGGSSATFTIAAVSNNSGGVLGYQWQKDNVNIDGQTGTSLVLGGLTGAATGTYSVVVTDTSSLGVSTTTRSATLIVVDATRPLLINGDINTAATPTVSGNGILRLTGLNHTASELGGDPAVIWNGVVGAAGTATRTLAKESAGLSLPGVSFTYAGAEGVEDNATAGFIASSAVVALSRDYLYTDNQTTPLTASIGGLDALVGKKVTLLVYAYGKLSTAFGEVATSDTATVTLTAANNHLGTAPMATTTLRDPYEAGRKLEDNNLGTTAGLSAAYVSFDGVVAPDGTVSWSLGADADGGRIPLVGFQLLVTGEDVAPPAPTNLAAVGGNAQVSLTWTASAGAGTYTIKRATTSGGPYTTISAGAVSVTNYTDTTAVNGTTYYYVVAAANALAVSANSNQASATPANTTTALQNWRFTHFGSTANTGNGANTADFDGDGLVNLLEYALGTNPTVAGTSPVALGQSGGTLTLTFSPVVDANLTYIVEASSNLAGAWETAHNYGAFASTAPVTYTDSIVVNGGNPRRFLRLRVTTSE